MKTLVMHIGDFKTGSTSLQLALGNAAANGCASNNDLFYCMAGGEGYKGHHSLVNEIKGFDYLRGRWAKLGPEIKKNKSRNFVVSSEAFWGVHPVKVKQMVDNNLPDVKLKIVVYLRPHHSRILAAYTQKVKTGQLLDSLDAFVEASADSEDYRYAKKVGLWRQQFPNAEFVIRPFIPSLLTDGDVIRDFCVHALGTDKHYLDAYKLSEQNESPSVEVLELMRSYTQSLNPKQHYKRADQIERQLLQGLRATLSKLYPRGEDNALRLSPESCDLIRRLYEDDAKEVDEKFFDDTGVFESVLNGYQSSSIVKSSALSEREYSIHHAYSKLLVNLLEVH